MLTLLQIESQLTIKPLTDQTMSSLEKEILLSYIDNLKRTNIQTLSKILNNYWSAAAFEKSLLDHQIILHLIKKIKTNGLSIQKICQSHPNYIPWTLVRRRKRKCFESKKCEEKKRKNIL